ncbi:hypothetical protein SGPA1_12297 [Streptomyces misionensis JCM 4497]
MSLRSRYVSRQYRGVHDRGRRRARHRHRAPRRRRDPRHPDDTGRPRLPPDEPRPLPRRGRDLRPAVLHPGPAAADLRRPRGRGGRGELDRGGRDRRSRAVRAADERAVGTFRPPYAHDRVAVGRGGRRPAGPLRAVDRRAGGAARGAGRGAGRAARVGAGVPGRGGAAAGAGHGDRAVRGRQQRRWHERPADHRLGGADVGLAGLGRRDRGGRGRVRGGVPAAAASAAALHGGLAAPPRPARHGPRPSARPAAAPPVRDRRAVHDGVRRRVHGDRLPADGRAVRAAAGHHRLDLPGLPGGHGLGVHRGPAGAPGRPPGRALPGGRHDRGGSAPLPGRVAAAGAARSGADHGGFLRRARGRLLGGEQDRHPRPRPGLGALPVGLLHRLQRRQHGRGRGLPLRRLVRHGGRRPPRDPRGRRHHGPRLAGGTAGAGPGVTREVSRSPWSGPVVSGRG